MPVCLLTWPVPEPVYIAVPICTEGGRCAPARGQRDLPLRAPACFRRNDRLLGFGNKVIAIFYGAHVRPAIYGDHTGHYGVMQMVDDTCLRAHMEGARHRSSTCSTENGWDRCPAWEGGGCWTGSRRRPPGGGLPGAE